MSDEHPHRRVVVVGGGVAGLTAGIFTARNGVETVVVNHGEPILARNAHLENFPGFPAGVDARLLLEMTRDQARRSGAALDDGEVERVEGAAGEFSVHLADGDVLRADYVVAASWSDATYLEGLDVSFDQHGSKRFVVADRHGRTGVDGCYAAGRLAKTCHQAVVAAGHGAEVATTLLDDSESPFYHDWVAPEGYFTGRDREVPPGCEEIDEAERRRRERRSLAVMREYFEDPHPGEPTQHPSVRGREE